MLRSVILSFSIMLGSSAYADDMCPVDYYKTIAPQATYSGASSDSADSQSFAESLAKLKVSNLISDFANYHQTNVCNQGEVLGSGPHNYGPMNCGENYGVWTCFQNIDAKFVCCAKITGGIDPSPSPSPGY